MTTAHHEKPSVLLALNDLRCPVTFKRYTSSNFPILLPCKHIVSIQGFEFIKSGKAECPSCIEPSSPTYVPVKKVSQDKRMGQQEKIYCRYHTGVEAAAVYTVWTEDRSWICLDCKDEVQKGRKIPVENSEGDLKKNEGSFEERIAVDIAEGLKPFIMRLVKLELENESSRIAPGRRESVFGNEKCEKITRMTIEKFKQAFGFDADVESEVKVDEEAEKKQQKAEAEAIKITLRNSLEVLDGVENYSCTKLNIDVKSGFKDTEVLCSKLAQLTNLKELIIMGMHNKQKFNDSDMEYLCAALEKMNELSFLKLDFRSCKSISDKGLKELGCYLGKNESLTSINLNFNLCEPLGDSGLKEIVKGLKQKEGVNELNLNFSWCSGITENGVNELSSLVMSMEKNLKDLKLNFYGCKEIKGEGLNNGLMNLVKRNEDFSMILPLNVQQK